MVGIYYKELQEMLHSGVKKEVIKVGEMLDKVYFKGKNWYVDYELGEIRDVNNPHDIVEFEDVEHLFDVISRDKVAPTSEEEMKKELQGTSLEDMRLMKDLIQQEMERRHSKVG